MTPEQLQRLAERRRGGAATPVRPAIVRRGHGALAPLTPTQEALWFVDQVADSSPFVMFHANLLKGRLDRLRLRAALAAVGLRHELLRSRLVMRDGRPFLAADAHAADLLEQPPACRQTLDARLAEARRPFDLTREQPLRVGLIPLGPEVQVLYVALHHLAGDAASLEILLSEIAAAYAGKPPTAPLAIQYGDYAAWLATPEQRARCVQEVHWWSDQLQDFEPFSLPGDSTTETPGQTQADRVEMQLDEADTQALLGFCRGEGLSPFVVCLAVFAVLLARHGGRTDLAVTSTLSQREQPELRPLIGLLVNKVALRLRLSGEGDFHALLAQVHQVVMDAFAHKHAPFAEVVRALPQADSGLERNPSRISFLLHSVAAGTAPLAGLEVEPLPGALVASEEDLECHLFLGETQLRLLLVYRTQLFQRATVEAMTGHFGQLLRGLLATPGRPLREVGMLGERERAALLALGQASPALLPHASLQHWFEAQAAATPCAIALEWTDGQMDFAELRRRAHCLAAYLGQTGTPPAARVLVMLDRGWPLAVAYLGVLMAGAVFVPLAPQTPGQRLRQHLQDCQADLLLCDRHGAEDIDIGPARQLDLEGAWAQIEQAPARALLPASPDAIAYAIYTSGSSGLPKAALLPQRAIVNHMAWWLSHWPLTASDAVLHKTSIGFDASIWEIFAPLLSGARLVFAPPDAERDPQALIHALQRHRITHLQGTPGWLAQLFTDPGIAACGALRQLFAGGEALTGEVCARIRQRLPTVRICNLYGPTEACIDALWHDCTADSSSRLPIGRPVAGMGAWVRDLWDDLAPFERPGELWLSGQNLAEGYLNRPQLSAERFQTTAQGPSYRTGDVARLRADGLFECLGRLDRQLKINGRRVEPEEVEQLLLQQPGVAAVSVDLGPDGRLRAHLVAQAGITLHAAELERRLAVLLPPYLRPIIQQLAELPRLPNGKLDRRTLAQNAAPSAAAPYRPARSASQRLLADCWARLLGRSAADRARPELIQYGLDDDFFACGGHSLLAMELLGELQAHYGPVVGLAELLRYPRLESLAAYLDAPSRVAVRTALVPLAAGARPGLVIFTHDVAGSIFPCVALARQLSGGRRVLGVQQPEGEETDATLQQRAQALVTQLAADLTELKGAAVCLVGYSFGAALGWELAGALLAVGVRVAGVLVLDQEVADATRLASVVQPDELDLLEHIIGATARHCGQPGPGRTELAALASEARLNRVAGWIQQVSGVQVQLPAQLRRYRGNLAAARHWTPPTLACPVTLLASRALLARHADDPSCGWAALSQQPVAMLPLAGDHYSLLQPPLLEQTATALDQALQRLFAAAEPLERQP
ncbi:MAG: amino acid adenylation domain-containing protein [Pseudomonas sp.]|uniref:non-ribosomal peptide synthetase n=1 Tax=Pseudomonas sp. TaxID=306 RepID=UPI00339B631E